MNTSVDPAELLRSVLRTDLSSFVQKTFGTIDPGTTYRHNWHIDAIAHQLQRIERGEITRLVITMPPRSLKSLAASVAFPAWYLGKNPRKRVLAVSYADSLAEKLASDCQKVLMSNWYHECFPATRVSRGRRARHDFETTRQGGRCSTSIGGSLTGRGGDLIIIDDPHKPEEAGSENKRKAVLDWYRSTLLTRLNDPAKGAIVLIQQRVHENDLAGTVLEDGGWEHLNLPAIAEEPMIIDLGYGREKHLREGDLLHPERLSKAVLDERCRDLGSYKRRSGGCRRTGIW